MKGVLKARAGVGAYEKERGRGGTAGGGGGKMYAAMSPCGSDSDCRSIAKTSSQETRNYRTDAQMAHW